MNTNTTAPPPNTNNTNHSNVACDFCKVCPIVGGVRFKCGNCVDYDLCQNCIGRRKSFHDPSHVFLYLDDYWGHNATDPPLLRQLLYNPPGIGGVGSVTNSTSASNSGDLLPSVLRLEHEFGFVMEEYAPLEFKYQEQRTKFKSTISLLDFIKDKTNEVTDWERSVKSSSPYNSSHQKYIQSRLVQTDNLRSLVTHPTCLSPTDKVALTKFVQDEYGIQNETEISTTFATLNIYEPATTAAQQRMQDLLSQGKVKHSFPPCMGRAPTGYLEVVGYSPNCQGGEAYIMNDDSGQETILASSSTLIRFDGTSPWQWHCINPKKEKEPKEVLYKPLISGYRIHFTATVFK